MTLPIDHIQVQSKYVMRIILAAVLSDPSFPLILGCKYVYLAETWEPVLAATVQTRSKTDPDLTIECNPLPNEMQEAQDKDELLKLCFHKLVKTRNPPKSWYIFIKSNFLYH